MLSALVLVALVGAAQAFKCESAGSFVDEVDCAAFHRCVARGNGFTDYPGRCPAGTMYSQAKGICDWPANVDCTPLPTTAAPTHAPTTKGPTTKPGPTTEPGPTTPYVPPTPGSYRRVCYFVNWATYRNGTGKFVPEDLQPELCTNVIYAFATLDEKSHTLHIFDEEVDIKQKFYERVTALKSKGVKVSIAIGGWTDSKGSKYSDMVTDPKKRANFVSHVTKFIGEHNFDGLDLDWEYPRCWQANCNGPRTDKANFVKLTQELQAAFKPHGYILSAAVGASKWTVGQAYDIKALGQSLDFINLMTYDLAGIWDRKTGHHSQLFVHPKNSHNFLNSDWAMKHWVSQGAPANKMIMGIPLYGRSFTLGNKANTGLNSGCWKAGKKGPFTGEAGFLAYYEICADIKKGGWTIVQDPTGAMGPYAYKGDQWVGYDDQAMIAKKTAYIKKEGYGGAMVWDITMDDFHNLCGEGSWPLMKAIAKGLAK